MGPITLFDKSFLQSLSVDESVWFDHFFLTIIAPFFYIETLADLGKPQGGRHTPESEVRVIADKFPDMYGRPCVHHVRAALSNLFGKRIPMDGTVPLPGGRPIKQDGRTGIVWDESPESKAFLRWQAKDFLSVEQDFACAWRRAISTLPLDSIWAAMRAIGVGGESSRSLEAAKQVANDTVDNSSKSCELLALALLFLGASPDQGEEIFARWKAAGSPPFREYAPYAAFVLTVEIFFQVALAACLIARERPSNRVDIAYLYYLPFCMVFVSSDRLHAKTAPLFLREDQDFVWGGDLKVDLDALNKHFSALPDSEKARGVMTFSYAPPEGLAPVVTRLWDRHMTHPLEDENAHRTMPEEQTRLVEHFSQMDATPTIPSDQIDFDNTDTNALLFNRTVRRRKGSWLQVPEDVE